MIRRIWNRWAYYGIPEGLSLSARNKEIITNEIGVLVIAVDLLSAVAYIIGTQIGDFPVAYLYLIITYGVLSLLNFILKPRIPLVVFKTVFYGLILAVVTVASLFAGIHANLHLILAASILAPFVSLNYSEKKLLIVAVTLNILATMGLVLAFNFMEPLYPLHGTELAMIQGVMFLFYLIPVVGFGHFVWKETNLLERFLEEEKDKSDLLLRNILPEVVANELKNKGKADPKFYEEATVLFTDFVGFTKISTRLKPQELVGELHLCFSYFDSVMKKYHLEKLKTIGDAYMAVAGVPKFRKTHAVDAVMAALEIKEIIRYMKEYRSQKNDIDWEIRIGIHSGSLVAGIIGEEKFAYDVWGATVNTAARMESAGASGRVNISRDTYELVKDFFECEYRGKMEVKNIGELDMYFVNSLKKEYLYSEDVLSPNKKFLEEYERLSQEEHQDPDEDEEYP